MTIQNDLSNNLTLGSQNRYFVKSKKKETNLLASTEVFPGGLIIVVKYGATNYTLLTDGESTFTELKAKDSGGGGTVAWNSITGKPTTFAPIIGTTATTALAGNTALLQIGTTVTTAKAGNYTPPNATTSVKGLVNQAATQANSVATDVAGLVTDFNALIAKLRTAGLIV